MVVKRKSGEHKWLKRILIAAATAVIATLFTRRKVLAPSPTFDFQLPPAPNAPTPNPPADRPEPAVDLTSEGLDITTQEGDGEAIDLSDAALGIDVELEIDDEIAPELTSEGIDTSEPETAGALASGEGFVRLDNGEQTCPAEFPIKGNASSHIYHLPGESSYEKTIPEFCFSTEEIAQSMGFRPRKH
ncbi:MAG: hypothetical protein ACRDHN_03790 [Thermomicrobiales bacterium]